MKVDFSSIQTEKILLGRTGENERTQVQINCAAVYAEYPSAVASLVVKAPNGDKYPVATTVSNNAVIWDVLDSMLVHTGVGEYQLTFTLGDVVAKSAIGKFVVTQSIEADGSMPSVIEDWMQEANEALGGIPNQVADAVDDYVSTNWSSWSGALDRTLSSSQSAAPADMVGDLKSAIGTVPTGKTVQGQIEALQTGKADMIVVTDSTPAAVMTFADGADDQPMALNVAVEPVQDLHGYDYPWHEGGNKNLIPMTVADIKAANPSGTWSGNSWVKNGVTFTIMTDNAGNVTGINVNGTSSADAYFHLSVSSKTLYSESCIASLESSISPCSLMDSYTGKFNFSSGTKNFTGGESLIEPSIIVSNGVSVSNVLVKPMIRLSTVTDPTFAPYSNICPISGWTGAKVANISDSEKQPYFAGLLNGTYGFVDLGTLNWTYDSTNAFFRFPLSDGVATSGASGIGKAVCQNYILVSNGAVRSTDKSFAVGAYWTYGSNVYIHDSAYSDAATFKTAMSGVYLVYELATPTTPTITKEQFDALLEEFGIEGWLVPISWQSEAGTVYGGTLTVNKDGSGTLVVDRACDRVSPSLTWNYGKTSSDRKGYCYCPSITIKRDYSKLICSHFKTVSAVADVGITISGGLSTGQIQFYVDALGIESASEFVTFLTNNEVYYTYALSTPVTYTLTAEQVKTLLGVNNIWADTGDILSVDYPADTKLYIDGKIASLQALILENISNT